VLKFPKPKGCNPPGPAIDADDIAAKGAYALYIDGGQVRIETVADTRGDRPWTATLRKPDDQPAEPGNDEPGRGQRVR
jgi:hypothetical protein